MTSCGNLKCLSATGYSIRAKDAVLMALCCVIVAFSTGCASLRIHNEVHSQQLAGFDRRTEIP